MGIGVWLKNLFKKDDTEIGLVCPKCGSTDFSYFTYLCNFVEVMREIAPARYVKSGRCNNCGYTINEVEEL